MKLAGITNLRVVPELEDPESLDVKIILLLYSLDSFLFRTLNEGSRNQNTALIATLGPFAVALTKIVNHVQVNRQDGV